MSTKMLGSASSDAEREIEAVLRSVQPWSGRAMHYAPVPGGISNSNWRVLSRARTNQFE